MTIKLFKEFPNTPQRLNADEYAEFLALKEEFCPSGKIGDVFAVNLDMNPRAKRLIELFENITDRCYYEMELEEAFIYN